VKKKRFRTFFRSAWKCREISLPLPSRPQVGEFLAVGILEKINDFMYSIPAHFAPNGNYMQLGVSPLPIGPPMLLATMIANFFVKLNEARSLMYGTC
jgi:hypothetical protein